MLFVRTSLALGTILIAGLVIIYIVSIIQQRPIHLFLAQIPKIQMGSTTLDEWQLWLRDKGLHDTVLACEAGSCVVSEHKENRLLHKLRLAPLCGITAYVNFRNGIASEVQVLVEIDDRDIGTAKEPGTGATVHWSVQARSCPQHYCTSLKEKWGHTWAIVELDSAVSKTDLDRAFAINTNCLLRIGGCKKGEAILPQIFGQS